VAYDSTLLEIGDEVPTGVVLGIPTAGVALIFEGLPADVADPQQMINSEIDNLSHNILGLKLISDPANQPPGHPSIGSIEGIGGVYSGTANNPQGPAYAVNVAIMSATDGNVTLVVAVIAPNVNRRMAFRLGGDMLARLEWPAP
jgi:hypothetical protein